LADFSNRALINSRFPRKDPKERLDIIPFSQKTSLRCQLRLLRGGGLGSTLFPSLCFTALVPVPQRVRKPISNLFFFPFFFSLVPSKSPPSFPPIRGRGDGLFFVFSIFPWETFDPSRLAGLHSFPSHMVAFQETSRAFSSSTIKADCRCPPPSPGFFKRSPAASGPLTFAYRFTRLVPRFPS